MKKTVVGVTVLTPRDRDIFLAMLKKTSTRPNKALCDAARQYKQQLRKP